MKTADGYAIKTDDAYPVSGKDADDYNYPLTATISTNDNQIALFSTQKTYNVVLDP